MRSNAAEENVTQLLGETMDRATHLGNLHQMADWEAEDTDWKSRRFPLFVHEFLPSKDVWAMSGPDEPLEKVSKRDPSYSAPDRPVVRRTVLDTDLGPSR